MSTLITEMDGKHQEGGFICDKKKKEVELSKATTPKADESLKMDRGFGVDPAMDGHHPSSPILSLLKQSSYLSSIYYSHVTISIY